MYLIKAYQEKRNRVIALNMRKSIAFLYRNIEVLSLDKNSILH